MKVSFKIEGLSELKAAIEEEFSKATATNIQKRVLVKAGEPIVAAAERMAPRETGILAASIKVGSKLSRRQKSKHKRESKLEMFVGPKSLVQATTSEFGTFQQSPHPFMRPAWDEHKTTAFDSIKDDLRAEIEKARQRAARKTARFLAKTKT